MLKSFYAINLIKQLPTGLLFRLLLLAKLVMFSSFALATDNDKVTLNFVNADIGSVIKAIGHITGKNFIIDPRVHGTVNIVSSSPIPSAMTYQVLLSALRTQGFAATENNGVTTILPEVDAKLRFNPTVTGNSKVAGDQIVTQVFTIKYESVNSLAPVIKPYISPSNVINAYPSTNMLIITDYAENLKKVAKLISAIDQPSTQENEVIRVKYANAVELAQTLNKLSDTPTANPEILRKVLVVADARSNTIIVRSDNPGQVNRIKQLVQQLDTQTTAGNSLHVVYLRNADAKKLAITLQAIISSNTEGLNKVSGANESLKTSWSTLGTNPSPNNTSTVSSPFAPTTPATSEPTSSGTPMVQADSATNSLIITAPDLVFNMLRDVIDKLDIRRAQLYIEALIAEVSTDKTSEFGIQWQDISNLNRGSNNIRAFGGTKFNGSGANILDVAQNVSAASNGLNLGVLKGQVTIPGLGTISNLGVLAHALESDANANILSKPNLLTLDNEEAKIVIGQNVPFITGQYAQSVNGGINPFQTIERQDVGLTLKVKPQISESDTIKLQIYQEVSSVVDAANSAGITTNKRSIDTSVLIEDGSIIVLGGLIEDRVSETVDSVPILGDIPLVGNLFKSQGRNHKKTNLMVFLRPYVIRDNQASQRITNERYEYIRNQEQLVRPKSNWILPDAPEIQIDQQ